MKRLYMFLLFFAMSYVALEAQTLRGTVTDDQGEALISATVVIEGTTIGTVTDFDGNYALDLDPGTHTIVVSYVGYTTQTQIVNVQQGRDEQLNFELGEDSELLDEVVVIGYGEIRKGDATGSLKAVDEGDFNRGAIISPDKLISGKIAGVNITSNNGEPGARTKIRIRGGTSITASNEPLYVIDGVPMEGKDHSPDGRDGRNPLNFLNPNDIETFTVLKDASATAIYGSRGANGVVLITTKRGEAGDRVRIQYDGYLSTSTVAESDIKKLNADQFRSVVTAKRPQYLGLMGNSNTDWFEELVRDGFGQNHSLSLTGGAEKIGYRMSFGYQEIEGILEGSAVEKNTIGLSLNAKALNDNLDIAVSVKGAFTRDEFDPGAIGDAYSFDPTHPVFDAANTNFGGYFEYGLANTPRNPVSATNQKLDVGTRYRGFGNIELKYKLDAFVPGLTAKVNLGADLGLGDREKYVPTTFDRAPYTSLDGRSFVEDFSQTSTLFESYLDYRTNLNNVHDITGLVGYSWQSSDERYANSVGEGFPNDIFEIFGLAQAEKVQSDLTALENRLISVFGRVNYSYKNKYLVTATVRRDGSTRFGPDSRWGTFPSFAVGWRVLEEDFAAGLSDVFSNLKVRFGWGIVGNEEIGDYKYLPLYTGSTSDANYFFGDNEITTFRPDAYDPALKWEETQSINAGIDFGFWNGRLNGTIEFYNKKTSDLLFEVSVPAGTNLSDRVLTNIGDVENTGVELTLNTFPIAKENIRWDLGFNIAYNVNEITAIPQVSEVGLLTGDIDGGVGSKVQVHQVGQSVNSFYLYEHKLDANGNPVSDFDGESRPLTDMYVDQDGDGIINERDLVVNNNAQPDLIMGLTTSLAVGDFDLGLTFRSLVGNYVYNNKSSNRGYYDKISTTGNAAENIHTSALVNNFKGPQYFSDVYLEDGSFVKLDNATIGYNIDKLFNTGGNARIYVTGQNLLTLTDYSGEDPEVDIGIDRPSQNAYPKARTFIFGLSLGF